MKMKDRITKSGVHIVNAIDGIGKPVEKGDKVWVKYTGYLENGNIFDSSDNKDPLSMIVGQGQVIKGWEEAIEGLKVGSKCTIIIPPELAYGNRSVGSMIPSNSILIFDIKVTKIKQNYVEVVKKESEEKVKKVNREMYNDND